MDKAKKMKKCAWCKHQVDGLCTKRCIEVDADYWWMPTCFEGKQKKKKGRTCRQCKNCVKKGKSYWCAEYMRRLEKYDLNFPKIRDCFVNAKAQEQYARPVQHLHCWACPNSTQREDGSWYCKVKESAVYKHDWCVLSQTTKPGKRVKAKNLEKFKEKEEPCCTEETI